MSLRCFFGFHDMVLLDRIVEEDTEDYMRERTRRACTRCCQATVEYEHSYYGHSDGPDQPVFDPATTEGIKQLKVNGYWPRKAGK